MHPLFFQLFVLSYPVLSRNLEKTRASYFLSVSKSTKLDALTLYSHVAQQCLTTVAESFQSYFGLLKAVKTGKVEQRPKLPSYRKPGLNLATFPRADVKLKEGLLRFPRQ